MQLELKAKFFDSWRFFINGLGFYDFIYSINGRDEYTDEVLDNYESSLELREAYLSGSLSDKLDNKLGRQIVVWGKSDNIRVTDVLNPLNYQEPGMTDIEDLRLPLLMTRIDYYLNKFNISAIAVHEHRYNKLPEFGSDFYPYSIELPDDEKPDEYDLENTEYALAMNCIFSGFDFSLYYAYFFNDSFHLKFDETTFTPSKTVHERNTMVRAALNIIFGNWILKEEAAYFSGIEYSDIISDFKVEESDEYSRIDVLGGIEYFGFTDSSVIFEVVNRHINEFDDYAETAGEQENQMQYVLRVSRDFCNDTLTLTFIISVYGENGDDGSYERFFFEYDWTDNIKITAGIVFYQSGDLAIFSDIEGNDRIFCDFKYSF